jgi:cellulose synthase (UDP-forming)
VLTVVATIAITPPRVRAEERFPVSEPCHVLVPLGNEVVVAAAAVNDLSLSGALLHLDASFDAEACRDGWLVVEIAEVGRVAGKVRRIVSAPDGVRIGLQFDLPISRQRDALILKIFTTGVDNSTHSHDAWVVTWRMILRVFRSDAVRPSPPRSSPEAPAHVAALCAEAGRTGPVMRTEGWDASRQPGPEGRPALASAA